VHIQVREGSKIYKLSSSDDCIIESPPRPSFTWRPVAEVMWKNKEEQKIRCVSIDTAPLEQACKNQAIQTVLESEELFWFLFCKLQNNPKSLPDGSDKPQLNFIENHSIIKIKGRISHILEHKRQIEEIRRIFMRNWAGKSVFTMVYIHHEGNVYFREKHDLPLLLQFQYGTESTEGFREISFFHTLPQIRKVCMLLKMVCNPCNKAQSFRTSMYDEDVYSDVLRGFKIHQQ